MQATKDAKSVTRKALALSLVLALASPLLVLALEWSDQTPPGGPWEYVDYLGQVEVRYLFDTQTRGYFWVWDSALQHSLFELSPNGWTDVTPLGGPWDGFAFLAEVGGRGYLTADHKDTGLVHLFEVGDGGWTDPPLPGTGWDDIAFLGTAGHRGYFSLKDPVFYEEHLWEIDTWTWNWTEIAPPAGPWNYVKWLSAVEDLAYFTIQDSSTNTDHLYEYDGSAWTERAAVGGGWSYIEFLGEVGSRAYFGLRDSAMHVHVYERLGSNWTDRTPVGGPWSAVEMLTGLAGKGYFCLQDDLYNSHLFVVDGDDWTSQDPPGGPHQELNFLAAIEGLPYFEFGPGQIFELNGTTWTDRTPTGTWNDGGFLAEYAGRAYFAFQDTSFLFHLYELDATSWVEWPSPGSAWSMITPLYEQAGKGYFSLLDGSVPYVYETDGIMWTDRTPPGGPWKEVELLAVPGRMALFDLSDDAGWSQLWEWDGTTWAEKTPTGGPWAWFDYSLAIEGRSYLRAHSAAGGSVFAGCIPLQAVQIDGPTQGEVGVMYDFVATALPDDASGPFDFQWSVTNVPQQRSIEGLTRTISVTWNEPGPQVVSVTVDNGCGLPVSDALDVTIGLGYRIYLPVVIRQ